MLRAVIFDLHGTLLDDEPLRMRLLQDLAGEQGIEIDPVFSARRLAGTDDRSALRLLWAHAGHPLPPDDLRRLLTEKQRRYAAALAGGVPLHPGARSLLEAASRAVPVGVIAASMREDAVVALKRAGLFRRLTALVTAEDAAMPSARAYEACLARMNDAAARYGQEASAARNVLVFEDREAGIAAAQQVGMKVAAVAHTQALERLALAEAQASTIAELDLALLSRELF